MVCMSFLKIRCSQNAFILLYPCISGCWAMRNVTKPCFKLTTLRSNKSYPTKPKLSFFLFCRYSPMIYTLELKVIPQVTFGCSSKNLSSILLSSLGRFAWRSSSSILQSGWCSCIYCLNPISLFSCWFDPTIPSLILRNITISSLLSAIIISMRAAKYPLWREFCPKNANGGISLILESIYI